MLPSLSPKIRLNEPTAINAEPRTSSRGRLAARTSGCIDTSAPITMIGAMITLMRNAHRHEYVVVRKPPTMGPNATAVPATAPHAANAFARSAPWNVFDRIDSVAGIIIDAPMPSINASPTKRVGTEWEIEARSDPMPKTDAPMMNMRRCP